MPLNQFYQRGHLLLKFFFEKGEDSFHVTNQMARSWFHINEKADSLQISIASNSETLIFLPVKPFQDRSQSFLLDLYLANSEDRGYLYKDNGTKSKSYE